MTFTAKVRAWATIATVGLAACSTEREESRVNDIFLEDEGDPARGNERRHPADNEEKLWTISMGGCTGHLISPEHMMTANHCSPQAGARYTSGAAMVRGERQDITVTQILEKSAPLDYAILKIQWTSGSAPREQKFPPLIATKASDVATGARKTEGDELFTVGFPGDKTQSWGATYAQGRAKTTRDNRLVYDIGIINGNSGGGVWRKSDKMLVSLTNGGPRMLNQAGWNRNNLEDQGAWNFGAAMWNVYAQSAILKDIFPGGRNRYAGGAGGDDDLGGLTGASFAALGAEGPSAASATGAAFTLAFSAPKAATKLIFCQTAALKDCKAGAAGYTEARLFRTVGDVSVFKADAPTALTSGLVLAVISYDGTGKPLSARRMRFDSN